MKLALISPYVHINSIMHTDYQLLLPQCLDNERYVRAYYRARRDGSYMIMDNGAAEGVETTPIELHNKAHQMMVNEIVVPDVMGDSADTVEQARGFEEWVNFKFNYMGVVQGSTMQECFECIDGLSQLRYINTLGIPRHLLSTINQEARIILVQHIRHHFAMRFKIHLLGTNPTFMDEFEDYGRAYESFNVRGVDTSAPYNYTLAGATLLDYAKEIARPDNYFEQRTENSRLARLNITIMKDWTYGIR